MVFRKNDPKTIAAGSQGGKNRKRPYYTFKVLKETNPKRLREIQSKGGKSKTAL